MGPNPMPSDHTRFWEGHPCGFRPACTLPLEALRCAASCCAVLPQRYMVSE
jgi:hypothetical protein